VHRGVYTFCLPGALSPKISPNSSSVATAGAATAAAGAGGGTAAMG
jgi:hypothetical protein